MPISDKIKKVSLGKSVLSTDSRTAKQLLEESLDKYPKVEIAKQGDLTDAQAKDVLTLAETCRDKLLAQWKNFKEGKAIRIIKIKK